MVAGVLLCVWEQCGRVVTLLVAQGQRGAATLCLGGVGGGKVLLQQCVPVVTRGLWMGGENRPQIAIIGSPPQHNSFSYAYIYTKQ